MENSSASDLLDFDFYICAAQESAAAQEINQIVQDAGYSVYFARAGQSETDIEVASRSKKIILLLTNDNEQTKRSIADFLNVLPSGDQSRVIIIQVDECEIANILDRDPIVDLSGLHDPQDRKLRILAAVENRPRSSRSEGSPMAKEVFALRPAPPPMASEAFPDRLEPSPMMSEAFPAGPGPDLKSGAPHYLPDDLHAAASEKLKAALWARKSAQASSTEVYGAGPSPTDDAPKRLDDVAPAPPAPYDLETRKAPVKDIVEFGVSHPSNVALGMAFIVDVLIYCQVDRSQAIQRAAELNPDNDRFRSAGATEVARGTKLSVQLELPWTTDPAVQVMYWNGLIANVSFRVFPTKSLPPGPVHGCCKISVDGLTIGQVFFRLTVGQNATSEDRRISYARAVKSAFASYASPDRRRVLARVQGIEKLGVKVFLDTHGLRANEEYKKRIFQAIDASDILYLFWSRHAKRSNWVAQEWRYGMRKKGLGFIDPVPLADPRRVPPPIELAEHKHFNDWTLIYSQYEKSLSAWARMRSWLSD